MTDTPFERFTDATAEDILALANVLHKTVPEGTQGGVVIAALVCLLGCGIRYAPKNMHNDLLIEAIYIVSGIVDGSYDVKFEPAS